MNVEVPSGRISYLDKGNGPAVLLIHAFPLNKNMWEPQLDVLAARFRVIVPDLRGFGESQPASPWTMDDLAADMTALLDRLNIASASVAGVSIGGYIALAFWRNHADRLSRLVISNSRARADNAIETAARNEMIGAIQQHGAAVLPDRMLPRLLKPNSSPEIVAKVRGMIEEADASAAAYAVSAMRDRMDFSSQLHRIACPAMIVCGESDAIIRVEESRAMAEAIPNARFVLVPDSGHLSSLENPRVYNAALVEFLTQAD